MKTSILIIASMLLTLKSFSQISFIPHVVRVIVQDPELIPYKGTNSNDPAFNALVDQFNIDLVTRPMEFAKTRELRNCFELYSAANEQDLYAALVDFEVHYPGKLLSIALVPEAKYLDTPNDHFWTLTTDTDFMWYLKKIKADQAWDITHGDPNVKVAIVDGGVDVLHPDLIGKIDPPYDFHTGQPFTTTPSGSMSHGTSVATLIAAETTDQGQANGQMPSIGWDTKVMIAERNHAGYEEFQASGNPNVTYFFDRPDLICFHASNVWGAKIINVSWYFFDYEVGYPFYAANYMQGINSFVLIEQEILNNGTSIIRAAGNAGYVSAPNGTNTRLYPFSGYEDPRTIVVSSTGPDDKHLYHVNGQPYTNSHYAEVDLCAPGYSMLCGVGTNNGTNNWPYGPYGGTSQSAPLVAGTAALMYAVNPCLAPSMLEDILKNTTDPIVDEANYSGLVGTGRLNAYEAVKAAQNAHSTTLDLYIKDRPEDLGDELYPYHWQAARDESPDIWVRNQPDGFTNTVNQEPEYTSGNPVYVYVKVRNKGCVPAAGSELLSLYWTKASSMTSWPENWDGSLPTVGNLISSNPIGILNPGEEKVIQFTWNILNPHIYDNWASCLMARIENAPSDPITIHVDRADDDVFYNNNVALRNCTVIDVIPGIKPTGTINGTLKPFGKYVFLANELATSAVYDFTFTTPGTALLNDAEVKLFFDETGWNILKSAISACPQMKIVKDREVILMSSRASLNGITISGNTKFPVYFGYSFYSEDAERAATYTFKVSQFFTAAGTYVGGEHFTINKHSRESFKANAGADKMIELGEGVTFSAEDIQENAVYNWYDTEGNLIYTGQELALSPEITKKYSLEVIALSDGAKSYDNVEVFVKKNIISSVSPNPAVSSAQVDYKLAEEVTSAYIMLVNQNATETFNFILDTQLQSAQLTIDGLTPGLYTMVLICNGIATDSVEFIKN